jgi:hypothetical protein
MEFNKLEASLNPTVMLFISMVELYPRYKCSFDGRIAKYDEYTLYLELIAEWLGCRNIPIDSKPLLNWQKVWITTETIDDLVMATGTNIRYINYHYMMYCLLNLNELARQETRIIK